MKFFAVTFLACVAIAAAAPLDDDQHAQVLRSSSSVNPDSYQYEYETSNGISAQEQGQLKNLGPEQDAITAQGQFAFSDKEGNKFQVSYVADENGFQPQGAHLPTPPEIPPQIARALEWLAAHPPAADSPQ